MSQVRTERRVEGAQTFRAGARRPLVAQPREFLDAGRPDGRVRVGARRGAVPLDAAQLLEVPRVERGAVRHVDALEHRLLHQAPRLGRRRRLRRVDHVQDDALVVRGVRARAAPQPVDRLDALASAEIGLDPGLLDAHVLVVLLPVRHEAAHVVDANSDHSKLFVSLDAEVVPLPEVRLHAQF